MRLTDFSNIYYGKENVPEEEKEYRGDTIQRIFLGDRQVWEPTDDEEEIEPEELGVATDELITTWNIVEPITLTSVTGVSSMQGSIKWGDGSTSAWRSGNMHSHKYTGMGTYDITFSPSSYFSRASFGRIEAVDKNNILTGVTLSKIPLNETKLAAGVFDLPTNLGVFEGINTIRKIRAGKGVKSIPSRSFYDTGITDSNNQIAIIISAENNINIGSYAIVRHIFKTNEENNASVTIEIRGKKGIFGTKCLGFDTNGDKIRNLHWYCEEDSNAAAYANSMGITIDGTRIT